MNVQQQLADQGLPVRHVEYDDVTQVAVDFGPGADLSVDIVDETVIVVGDDSQYEIDVAAGAQAFISNGVLSIEVEE